jgi:lysozyme
MAKTKTNTRLPRWAKYLLSITVFAFVVVFLYENKKYIHRAVRYLSHRYIKTRVGPSDFPNGYSIHGIDVSHYQDDVDWNKLIAIDQYGDTIPFRFAFIKATEGLLIEDNMFDEHWEDARNHHVARGAYHYYLADRSPKVQAANFISSVKLKKGDLPPVVDVEQNCGKTKAQIVAGLKDYLKMVQEHYKVKPIIYSNINFIEDYLSDDFKGYRFWVAHYYRDELLTEDSVQCCFWQHTDKADLLGIRGNVDANVFTGSKAQFDSLLIK